MADYDNKTGYVREMYSDGVKQIREELRSYWLNHAFLLGYQWVFWNTDSRRLDIINQDFDRIQPTMNRMRANARTIISTLTQRQLTFENPPTSYDDATIQSARLGEAIIKDIHDEHSWEVKREQHMMATLKGGTAAVSVDWDAENKTTIEQVLPIGDFLVEPAALDPETARWWIRKQALPPKQVQAMFDLPEEPPADGTAAIDPYMQRLVADHVGSGTTNVPRTFVLTYYERPHPLRPEGHFCVEKDNKVIQHGDWPFPWKDRLNIVCATETAVENRWHGATILDDVRPVQVALNATWANLLEHLRDAGTARMLIPQSASDLVNQLTDSAGEMIVYPDGTPPPMYMTPAQLTSWLREMPDKLSEMIDDLMGVHDVSRGMAPPNIESGLGLSILAEKDSSPIGRMIKETARCWSRVAQMVLQLHQAETKKPRETTLLDGSTPLRFVWKGSDIGGQFGIHVPLEAVVPRSRAAMQAFADKAMQMGLISNVVQYARVADLPDQKDIIAAAAPDAAKARRENGAFVMKEVMLPAAFDDHTIHIEMHNEFRKTQRYEQLDEEIREVVDLHIQAHETMAAEQAGRATMQANVNPALAAAPNADGSTPPVDMMGSMPPAPPPASPADFSGGLPAEMDPAQAILGALEESNPPPVQGG